MCFIIPEWYILCLRETCLLDIAYYSNRLARSSGSLTAKSKHNQKDLCVIFEAILCEFPFDRCGVLLEQILK